LRVAWAIRGIFNRGVDFADSGIVLRDGGLLAYGCNVFNLGFFTCFISYPCVYKWIPEGHKFKKNLFGSLISSIIGLQMGSFSVVIETLLSGKTELPFGSFVLLMQPIHLAIGVVEGLVTAAVVIFVWRQDLNCLKERTKESTGRYICKKAFGCVLSCPIIVGVFFPGLHHRLLTVLNGLLKRQQEQLNWKSRAKFMKHCRRYSRKPLFYRIMILKQDIVKAGKLQIMKMPGKLGLMQIWGPVFQVLSEEY